MSARRCTVFALAVLLTSSCGDKGKTGGGGGSSSNSDVLGSWVLDKTELEKMLNGIKVDQEGPMAAMLLPMLKSMIPGMKFDLDLQADQTFAVSGSIANPMKAGETESGTAKGTWTRKGNVLSFNVTEGTGMMKKDTDGLSDLTLKDGRLFSDMDALKKEGAEKKGGPPVVFKRK